MPPSSGRPDDGNSTRLHGAISQKAVIFIPPEETSLRVLLSSLDNHHVTIVPYSSITAPRMCDSPHHATHLSIVGPMIGASSMTRHKAGIGAGLTDIDSSRERYGKDR
jgi:hypothetical protein